MLENVLTPEEIQKLDSSKTKIINLNGKDVEIDIMIAELIKKLNEKGFTTKYCCSGHDDDAYTGGYIAFDMSVNVDIIEMICNIRSFKWEHTYTLWSENMYVDICNPTIEQMLLAKSLILTNNEEFDENEKFIVRLATQQETREIMEKYNYSLEDCMSILSYRNKVQTYLAFKLLMDLVDSYGTENYEDNLKRLEEYNNNLKNGYGNVYYPFFKTVGTLQDEK